MICWSVVTLRPVTVYRETLKSILICVFLLERDIYIEWWDSSIYLVRIKCAAVVAFEWEKSDEIDMGTALSLCLRYFIALKMKFKI